MLPGRWKILFAAWLFALPATPAWPASLEEVVRALERPFQAAAPAGTRIDDYQADFSQEARIASLDRVQQASGQVSVRFEHHRSAGEPTVMFRWEYAEPNRQELISDGKTLWVYLPENHQVVLSERDPAVSRENDPMTFLTGLGSLSRDFRVGFAVPERDGRGNYVLELRPRTATALLERLLITVSRAAAEGPARGPVFPIVSSAVHDPNGNSTLIIFDRVRLNQRIPASRFSFTPPAGVEVVRPPGRE